MAYEINMDIGFSIYFTSVAEASTKCPARAISLWKAQALFQPSNSRGLEPAKADREPGHSGQAESVSLAVVAKALGALIERAWAAAEAAVARILFWQEVSRRIERQLLLSDSALQRKGLERNRIVPTAYRSALDRWERQRGR